MEHEHAASLTARAVKKTLPGSAILTTDARKTINSAVSMFTLYLASLAHETSIANKRSTITLNDVLQTLRDVDFEHFIEPIEACVQEAKAAATRKKNEKSSVDEEKGDEMASDFVEQLDEVAIDTNEEEDADEDEDMMSPDELLVLDEKGSDGEKNREIRGLVQDSAMQDEAEAKQELHDGQRKHRS